MDLPEDVVRHDFTSLNPCDMTVCDCGAEQRAREDGARWLEWAADEADIGNVERRELERLAEQLRKDTP